VLLDGWRTVERRTGARLALVGDGPLRRRLQARPDAARVSWLPYEPDRGRLADLMASVDLVVTPSPTETFGLAALEAMASGTPVLAADKGGVAELVSRSCGGMLFPSGDRAGLAQAAIDLLQGNPVACGARGRAYAEEQHAWDRVFDRIVAVYRQVLSGL
jgi:glycosyltransferase involved in cell wall biosynthesis